MNEIYLIRHAKSEANEKHIFGTDMRLSFEGQAQCVKAREYYQAIKFDEKYSSTKVRAITTATLVFQSPISPDRKLKEFDEIYFGYAEGKADTRKGIEGYNYQYMTDFIEFMKECEGDDPFERVKIALDKLQELSNEMKLHPQQYPNNRICIVTSDTLMRCIILTLKYQKNWSNINDINPIDNLDALKFIYDEELVRIEHFHNGNITECLYENKK